MSDQEPRLSELIAGAQYVEQLLNSELQWLSNRVSWLFVSQAFCLAAHAVVVTADVPVSKSPLKDPGILLWAMPLFGMLSCMVVYVSVRAAEAVAYRLADERARLTRQINAALHSDIPLIGGLSEPREQSLQFTRGAGAAPHHILPFALFFVWMALFGARLCSC